MSTTRWLDKETTSLERAVGLLLDEVVDEERSGSILWENWIFQKVYENNQSIYINGRDVSYNVINCTFDQTSHAAEDRTIPKATFVIVYHNGESINYIIDQNSSAQKMLRKLLSYTGRNEIEKNMFSFPSDFFVWLICKVYKSENVIEANGELSNLNITSIKAFKGDTEDSQTKVSASGESVMNVISTLSFLLESSRLNQIKLELSCTKHENISIVLSAETVTIDFNPYIGDFELEKEDDKKAKLYLLVYLEVLPIIEQEYLNDVINEIWNKETQISFLRSVANNLLDRVNQKITFLNSPTGEQP